MVQDDVTIEKYEMYEALFDPAWVGPTQMQGKRANHKPRKSRRQILAALTDDLSDVDLGLNTTYKPSRYEQGWLLSSLFSFFDEGLITDVLALIKGGKEASVYLCQANSSTGLGLLAAKVYCGFGYWVYDLAASLAHWRLAENWPRIRDALLEGYAQVRPFPAGQLAHLDLFMAARHVTEILWATDMAQINPGFREELPKWLDWADRHVRQFLGDG